MSDKRYDDDALDNLTDEEKEEFLQALKDDPDEEEAEPGPDENQDGADDAGTNDAAAKPDTADAKPDAGDAPGGDDPADTGQKAADHDAAAQAAAEAAAKAKAEEDTKAADAGDDKPDGDDGQKDNAAAGEDADKAAQPSAAAPGAQSFPKFAAPEDADAQIAAIDKDLDDLAEKFDDGEITGKEFRQQQRELMDKRTGLEQSVFKATFSAEARKASWDEAVKSFLADHDQYEENTPAYSLLNGYVKELQAKHQDNYNPAFLKMAHDKVEAYVKSLTAPAKTADDAKDEGDDKIKTEGDNKAGAKPGERPAPPPNLGQLPSAGGEEVEGGKFAHLDRLDGEQFEAALAKLTPEEQDEYMERA